MRAPLALERVHRIDPFLLAARSTLVALLVVVHTDRPVLVFAAVATAVLFLQEHLLRSPWPWFVIAAVLGRDQLGEWWLVDDHVALMTYWLVAVGLSRFATEPDAVLRQSARWVIVGVFAFAFGWKLLSSQYLSGDFFEHTLLRDPRFEPWATWVGGADATELAASRSAVSTFTAAGDVGDTLEVDVGPRTVLLANVLTYFGLVIEGAVALSFALPLRRSWRPVRHVALIAFCVTTYSVVPVAGFGLLLLSMGLAHARGPGWRTAYLAAGVFVFVWSSILAGFIL